MQRFLQISAVVVVAAIAAFQIMPNSASTDVPDSQPNSQSAQKFDMLSYLDQQIAAQECVKDVRCWSSVSKLQMFAAGAPIEHDALAVRIESYNDLLDSIWNMAATDVKDEISAAQLTEVLKKKFPGANDKWEGFAFLNSQTELVMSDLLTDYSDTIESWRIIQSWVARKADQKGQVNIAPPYTQTALDEFQTFLVKFDIALLRHAKDVAEQNKKSVVDAESMRLAFADVDATAN